MKLDDIIVLQKRFWEKVDVKKADRCWEWTASIQTNGYGQFAVRRVPELAHRVSWMLHNHQVLEKGVPVKHKCENLLCVNPYHLDVDHNANVRGPGKLRLADVKSIRTRYNEVKNYRRVAREFHISPAHAKRIVIGEQWKDKDAVTYA